ACLLPKLRYRKPLQQIVQRRDLVSLHHRKARAWSRLELAYEQFDSAGLCRRAYRSMQQSAVIGSDQRILAPGAGDQSQLFVFQRAIGVEPVDLEALSPPSVAAHMTPPAV